MVTRPYPELMARYNQWMNEKVYSAAGGLSDAELRRDRGAFFGSILGTLNHLLVADTIWLKRFAAHPGSPQAIRFVRERPDPAALDQVLHEDLASLRQERRVLDEAILEWARDLDAETLAGTLDYRNTKGEPFTDSFLNLVQHFFNHQTHHRGQVTTLLSQAGLNVGSTDLLVLIRN